MTARDPDRLIHDFVLEGAERLNDQIYDAIRADIERRPQRVVIGPWRMPVMNKLVPIALGAAAVVAVVFGLQQRAPSPGGVGGNSSTAPSPTPVASVAAPSPSVAAASPSPSLHVLSSARADGSVGMTVTIPAGWSGEGGILVKGHESAPDGAGLIVFSGPQYVFGDPCKWSTTAPAKPATTVAKLVTALTAQKSREASAPTDVTLNGYHGKSVTLHVPDDAVFADCDGGLFGSWRDPRDPDQTTPSRYHQAPGQIDELWIVDVAGNIALLDAGYYVGTSSEDLAEMRAIVESVTFEAP